MFLEWETFQAKVVDEIKTRRLCAKTFFEKHALWGNVENYIITGQATDDNMAYEHWTLDT
jgi:hypothetical protein